jgi:YVTN family beta-propeller protein
MFGEWIKVLRLETERLSLHTDFSFREGPFTLMLRSLFSVLSSGWRLASVCAVLLLGTSASALAFSPVAAAQSAPAPKAYVGLFKDNAVAVLDTGTNQIVSTIPVPTGPHGIVITPDNRWVYVSSDGASTVSVIDTNTDAVTDSIEVGNMPHGLAITPDGSMVLVAGFGTSQVSAIDTATNQILWKVGVPNPHNIAITQDGKSAYVASQGQNAPALATIDLTKGTPVGTLALDKTPRALNVSPDGQELFFTEAGVDAVQVLDLATNQIVAQIPAGASPHLPSFTPDGNLGLVVAQGPGELDLVDPDAYTNVGGVKVGTMPHWTATSADSSTAYVTNELSNDVSVVDLGSQTVTATIAVGNAPRKIVVQQAAAPAPTAAAMDT